MDLGIDYAAGRPSPAAIAAHGYRVVCRYLSRNAWKVLDPAERDGLLAAGLDLVLVFEDGADNPLHGASAGTADGAFAAGQAGKLGAPAGTVIYFAVDQDTSGHDAIAAYLDAARTAIGHYRVGVYGSYDVCRHALAGKHAAAAWQTAAWSGGKVLDGTALYQRAGTVTVDGVQCDVDEIHQPAYGGWRHAGGQGGGQGGGQPATSRLEVSVAELRPGASGQAVRNLQALLNAHRDAIPAMAALPPLDLDGVFGERTERMVDVYKSARKLGQPGVVGSYMWASLVEN